MIITPSTRCWHYQKEDETIGPIAAKDMSALVENGDITHDTLIWRVGWKKWKSAKKVFSNSLREIPPPLKSSPQNQPPPLPGSENPSMTSQSYSPDSWTGGAWSGLIIASLVIPLIGIILGIIYLSNDATSTERKRQAKILLITGGSIMAITFILFVISQMIFAAFMY